MLRIYALLVYFLQAQILRWRTKNDKYEVCAVGDSRDDFIENMTSAMGRGDTWSERGTELENWGKTLQWNKTLCVHAFITPVYVIKIFFSNDRFHLN